MASKKFNAFLKKVSEKLFPNKNSEILSPESPPNWTRLGWKVGWIIEEGHTGLQWWVTEDVAWKSLTKHFGNTKRQKKEGFASWYTKVLDDLSSNLGKPLSFESLKYRAMDIAAFEGRPLIEEEDWWNVTIETNASGQWNLIFTERFVRVFEEDVQSSPEPEPPWTFLGLWGELTNRQKKDLLKEIGTSDGLINHLAGLVVSGNLDLEHLTALMARQPREELVHRVDERRDQLEGSSSGRRKQTLDQWKEDAENYLTDTVGDWLENDNLPSSRWKKFSVEWEKFNEEVLMESFKSSRWRRLWENLSERDLKQILPRLSPDELKLSLKNLRSKIRKRLASAVSGSLSQKLASPSTQKAQKKDILKSRQEVFSKGKDVLNSMDYECEGCWSLDENEEN